MRFVLALVFLSCLSACGENFFIAEKVKFKVSFSDETVQVSFDLQKDYQIRADKTVEYEELGKNFLTWNESKQQNNIGTFLAANKKNLANTWPIEDLRSLPNGKPFPPAVGDMNLLAWKKMDEQMQWDFSFNSSPRLLAGSTILSDQFDRLPRGFLATQNFKIRNGTVVASISVMGPTRKSKGGVFFVGNFGENPYENAIEKQNVMAFTDFPRTGTKEWEVQASEPAKIISKGSDWRMPFILDLKNWFIDLSDQIAGFSG